MSSVLLHGNSIACSWLMIVIKKNERLTQTPLRLYICEGGYLCNSCRITNTKQLFRAIERIALLLLIYILTHIISHYRQFYLTILSKQFFKLYIYINCVKLYLLIIYFQVLNIKTNIIMVYYILDTCIYIIICTCGVAWLVYV